MVAYLKRLEAGKFSIWPVSRSGESGADPRRRSLGLSSLEGIDWRNPRWTATALQGWVKTAFTGLFFIGVPAARLLNILPCPDTPPNSPNYGLPWPRPKAGQMLRKSELAHTRALSPARSDDPGAQALRSPTAGPRQITASRQNDATRADRSTGNCSLRNWKRGPREDALAA